MADNNHLDLALRALSEAHGILLMMDDERAQTALGWVTTAYLQIKASQGDTEGLTLWERVQNDFSVTLKE